MKTDDNIIIKKQKLNKLSIPIFSGYLLIDYDAILYLEANNTYTTFHLTDDSMLTASKNLGYFEEKLIKEPFIRTHHSFIVNLTKIKEFKNIGDRGEVILTNEKSIPVSRSRKDALLKLLK